MRLLYNESIKNATLCFKNILFCFKFNLNVANLSQNV
nr:MAG TPA: hypothetical protein [Caudoviricetes sp.]